MIKMEINTKAKVKKATIKIRVWRNATQRWEDEKEVEISLPQRIINKLKGVMK